MSRSLVLLALSALPSLSSAFAIREATDKSCGYGDACWPNAAAWKMYEEAIFQYLLLQKSIRAAKWSDLAIVQQPAFVIVGAAFKPNVTDQAAEEKLWDPLRTWAASVGAVVVTNFKSYGSQYEVSTQEMFAAQHQVPFDTQKLLSRLVPASVWNDQAKLKSIASFVGQLPTANILNVPGGQVTQGSKDMALNPAWRSALSHIVYTADWAVGASQADQSAARQAGTEKLITLTNLVGSDAAYINESDPDDQSWPHNYWGDNYSRLLSIKKKYDPKHYFTCTACIGSETPAGVPF
ncbi:hypothetical protein BT69DRAFT_1300372 [Atractiella rhizophila]|nr:hypothetical protein BT69DRAFT_1300372 [Atractiella rhizophila]